MTAALGGLVGAFLAFVVVLVGLPPSPEALTDEALALVLPDSELVDAGANTGATIIVGWERIGVATFRDDRPRNILHELMLEHARNEGWTINQSDSNQYARHIRGSKPLTNVRIETHSEVHAGKRVESSEGTIVVSRNEQRRAALFWGFVIVGGVGGAALGRWAEQPTQPAGDPLS